MLFLPQWYLFFYALKDSRFPLFPKSFIGNPNASKYCGPLIEPFRNEGLGRSLRALRKMLFLPQLVFSFLFKFLAFVFLGVIRGFTPLLSVAIPSFLLYLICFFSFLRLRKARSPRSALALLAMTGKLTLTLTSPRKGEEKSSGMRTSSSLV